MRRIKITGLVLVVVLGTGAIAAGTASASTKLTLSEGGVALAAGSTFEVYGKDNVLISTPDGNIECNEENPPFEEGAGLGLEVVTNSKVSDELRVTSGVGVFDDRPVCRTGTFTFGRAEIFLYSSGLLRLTSAGKGSEVSVIFLIRFERGPEECYFKGAFRATTNAGSTREPLQIEYSGRLPLDKPLTHFHGCPTKLEMSGSFPSTRIEAEEEEEHHIEEQT